jgi:hypothetical protein
VKITANASWNNNAIARVRARLQERVAKYDQRASIEIGVGGEDADIPSTGYDGKPSGATLGQVARWMEFGTKNVPERSVLRGWFDQRAEQMRTKLVDAVRKHYVIAFAEHLAEELRELYKAGAGNLYEELAEATKIARAHAGLPEGPALVATKQLVNAIKARIDGKAASSFTGTKLSGRW